MRSASRAVALVAAGGMLFVAACTEDSTTPIEVEQERPWSIDQTAPLSSFASTARASRTDPRLLRALARVRPPRGPRRLGVCFYYVRVGGAYEAHKVRIPVATEETRGRSGIRGRQTYRYWRLSPDGEVRRLAVCTIPRTDEAIEATWDYFRVGGSQMTAASRTGMMEGILDGLGSLGSVFGPAPLHAAQTCADGDEDPADPDFETCEIDGIDVDVDRCDNPYHDWLGDAEGCGCANGFLTLDCTDPSPWDDDDNSGTDDDAPDIGGGGGGSGTGDGTNDPPPDCDPELDSCDPCDPSDEICEPDCELDPLAEGCECDMVTNPTACLLPMTNADSVAIVAAMAFRRDTTQITDVAKRQRCNEIWNGFVARFRTGAAAAMASYTSAKNMRARSTSTRASWTQPRRIRIPIFLSYCSKQFSMSRFMRRAGIIRQAMEPKTRTGASSSSTRHPTLPT